MKINTSHTEESITFRSQRMGDPLGVAVTEELYQSSPDWRPHAQGMNRVELNQFLNTPPKPSTKKNPFGL